MQKWRAVIFVPKRRILHRDLAFPQAQGPSSPRGSNHGARAQQGAVFSCPWSPREGEVGEAHPLSARRDLGSQA
eukprot:2537741-Pyramimonas_sp.AAC.1